MSLRSELGKPFAMISRQVRYTLHELKARGLSARRPAAYSNYLRAQLRRSFTKWEGSAPFQGEFLVEELDRWAQQREQILCIGCRSAQELEMFERRGFHRVVGVDLFSTDPRIRVMDFHHLEFDDQSFSVVFSSHSLEHSMYPEQAAREFVRVCRSHGLIGIEVPIQFPPSDVDLQDYQSVEGLWRFFAPHPVKLVWSEMVPAGDPRNRHGNPIVRAVMQKG